MTCRRVASAAWRACASASAASIAGGGARGASGIRGGGGESSSSSKTSSSCLVLLRNAAARSDLARWSAPARGIYGAARARPQPPRKEVESRGARAERLREARVKHEVRLYKERAKNEVANESWVRDKEREHAAAYAHDLWAEDDDELYGTDGAIQDPEEEARRIEARRAAKAAAKAARAYYDAIPIEAQKTITVGIVGVPNAGKSQLTNTLAGSQVSAVSPKTNTTRIETLATIAKRETQVILVDLPGVVGREHYRNGVHEKKVSSAWSAAADCDALVFIVDAHRQLSRPDPRVVRLIARARESLDAMKTEAEKLEGDGALRVPSFLALNKLDLFEPWERDRVKALARQLSKLHDFARVFPISAKRGKGTDALLRGLIEIAPTKPWAFDPTQVTDKTSIDQAIEVVRECVYQRLHKELPYNIVPIHDEWENRRDGSVKIEQYLVVDNVGVKQIVVGRRGSTIGQIGIRARVLLEKMWDKRVHLILNVRVRKKNNTVRGRLRPEEFEKY